MSNFYKKLEKSIDRKLKRNNSGKRAIGDLGTLTSLGWIFVIPIIIFIVIGNFVKDFFPKYQNLVMIAFIVLGIIFSCINIICVIKNMYKKNCKL